MAGAGEHLSITDETKIVALLARGDSYAQIRAHLVEHHGRDVMLDTITRVKKRNAKHLETIRAATLAKQEVDALEIKNQANRTIKKHLDNSETMADVIAQASLEYVNGKMSHQEYQAFMKNLKRVTLPELVSVSKEMHAQSGTEPEEGKSPEHLAAIREALDKGDEVTLNQIIFKGKDVKQHDTPPPNV